MQLKLVMAALCAFTVVKAETTRIQSIDEQIVQKQEQLSELGKKITGQEKLLESINKRYIELIVQYIDNKMSNKDKTGDVKKIRDKLRQDILLEVLIFKDDYLKRLKTELAMLADEFGKNLEEDHNHIRGLIKYYFICEFYEQGRLKKLIAQWQTVADELNSLLTI